MCGIKYFYEEKGIQNPKQSLVVSGNGRVAFYFGSEKGIGGDQKSICRQNERLGIAAR